MRFWSLIFLMLVLVGSAACSYEEKVKTESAVEQSVDRFHDQLNQQQYHGIYEESHTELRSRVTEIEFTAQLVNAHEQLGTITGKASVIIDDGFWRAFKRVFSGGRERVIHGNFASSDEVLAHERFVWAVENDAPRLISYELQNFCRKPCRIVFGRR